MKTFPGCSIRFSTHSAQATPLGLDTLELYREFVAGGGGQGDFSGIIKHLARRERD